MASGLLLPPFIRTIADFSRLYGGGITNEDLTTKTGRRRVADKLVYNGRSFLCLRILDGDTLEIAERDRLRGAPTTLVRLWGVDAPETGGPDGPEHFGLAAKDLVKRLAQGRVVQLLLEPVERSRGKYRRLLAYVVLPDGRILNQVLVATGYSYADARFNHFMRDELLLLQSQARSRKVGLWRDVLFGQLPKHVQGTVALQ